MDVILLGPWMLFSETSWLDHGCSSQNGVDHGRHPDWATEKTMTYSSTRTVLGDSTKLHSGKSSRLRFVKACKRLPARLQKGFWKEGSQNRRGFGKGFFAVEKACQCGACTSRRHPESRPHQSMEVPTLRNQKLSQ